MIEIKPNTVECLLNLLCKIYHNEIKRYDITFHVSKNVHTFMLRNNSNTNLIVIPFNKNYTLKHYITGVKHEILHIIITKENYYYCMGYSNEIRIANLLEDVVINKYLDYKVLYEIITTISGGIKENMLPLTLYLHYDDETKRKSLQKDIFKKNLKVDYIKSIFDDIVNKRLENLNLSFCEFKTMYKNEYLKYLQLFDTAKFMKYRLC